jgi:hypothetical protein
MRLPRNEDGWPKLETEDDFDAACEAIEENIRRARVAENSSAESAWLRRSAHLAGQYAAFKSHPWRTALDGDL